MDYLQTTQQTVSWLKKASDAGELDIHPPYQRNPVWLNPQKSFLIDSILRGYPIPELYMQHFVTDDGRERHVVVDGQQRIRACLEFIEGKFSLDAEDTPEYPDMTFDELPPQARKTIFQYKFVVRVLPEMAEEELRAIFGRLNRNTVALNKQELRHATYWGSFIKLMEQLADLPFWPLSGIFSPNDFRRMLDVEMIGELTIGYLHGPQNKKASLDKWYKTYEERFDEVDDVTDLFTSVLGEIDKVLPSLAGTRWSKKSDFYTLFAVFASHRDDLPLSREGREAASEALVAFGERVDDRMANDKLRVSASVRTYAQAVGRAASDLKNRIARESALEDALKGVWD